MAWKPYFNYGRKLFCRFLHLRRWPAVACVLGLRVRIPPRTRVFVSCVVSKRQKTKCRTIKTKKQARMKYRVQENTKRNPTRNMDVCVVCCTVQTKKQARTIRTKGPHREGKRERLPRRELKKTVLTKFSPPVQTGPGPHPSSYTMGTGSFQGVNWSGRGVYHIPPCRAEVKERVELYLSLSGPSWPVLG